MSKLGICLSGGGAKGAYQIGALKALEELGILQKASAFSGASIGAVNATFVAADGLNVAKEIWFNVPDNPYSKNASVIKTIREQGLKVIDSGLFSIKKLNQILEDNIDFELLKTKNVFIAIADTGDANKGLIDLLKSTYTHYIQKDPQVVYVPLKEIDKSMQIDIVVASCSIPIVFPPIITNSRKYRDGGFFDNTPIRPLIDFGCDEVICINISVLSPLRTIRKEYKDVNIHEIKATRRLGNPLDFSSEHSKIVYDYGYNDVMKYFTKSKEELG